jgi:hypothetical protein
MDPKARRHKADKAAKEEARRNPPAKMSWRLVWIFVLVPVTVLLVIALVLFIVFKALHYF